MVKTVNVYPEHERLRQISDQSQVIGEFLEYLNNRYTLAEYIDNGWNREILLPVSINIETLLADYFDIDLQTLNDEKEKMLEELANK